MRRFVLAVATVALAIPLVAQAPVPMPESYRQTQLNMLGLQRRSVLSMADSMPENLYGDKVTPIQRSFAEQLIHAAGAIPFVLGTVGVTINVGQDPAAAAGSRAALRSFVNAAYDAAEAELRRETADQRAAIVTVFGNSMPLWQVWDELHQHTFWTLGQVVANFRKHGMAPPGFGFF